jgi:hypothetical protein
MYEANGRGPPVWPVLRDGLGISGFPASAPDELGKGGGDAARGGPSGSEFDRSTEKGPDGRCRIIWCMAEC